jgi:hypothetical protein
MRALRTTVWGDFTTHVTTVMLESDASDTLESIRHRLLTPGMLVLTEIFEAGDDDIAAATLTAIEHQQANFEEEAHQAMLYFWTVQEWGRVRVPGALIMDRPAPMSHEAYAVALSQLANHPDRPAITIVGVSNDGWALALTPDGELQLERSNP